MTSGCWPGLWLKSPQPVLVVGRGSNLVISDQGWPGLAIRFGFEFTAIGIGPGPDFPVTAGAATTLPRLARETVNRGRGGLEFYVGIPGSVGGAVRTNAGGHGSETADWLSSARVFDLETAEFRTLGVEELNFSYRSSSIRSTDLVVSAEFRTEPIAVEAGQETLREITRWRKDHQPGGTLNAGSVFRNPRRRRRPAGSSMSSASRGFGSGERRCQPSMPTSSRPIRTRPPRTSTTWWSRSVAGFRKSPGSN